MIRAFDVFFSLIGLCVLSTVMVVIFLVLLFESRSPIFFQKRLGLNKKVFVLMKFRSMRVDAPSVPTHLSSSNAVTSFGAFLRKTKLDELPQFLNVIKGDMSLVGPRPCLESQLDLIRAREKLGVFSVRPGITGLAQLGRIDMSMPELLAKADAEMLKNFSKIQYFKYLLLTLLGQGSGDQIKEKEI